MLRKPAGWRPILPKQIALPVDPSDRNCPSASDYCYSKMDVVEARRSRLVGRSQRGMGRAYTSISIAVNNVTGCLLNRAIEISLPTVPTTFIPSHPFIPSSTAVMSDDELSDAPLSPLSTALDTAVLEASSRATNATATSFASELLDTAQFVKSGGKTYLVVDHTANQRRGANPLWI
jgi:hypothetical protein